MTSCPLWPCTRHVAFPYDNNLSRLSLSYYIYTWQEIPSSDFIVSQGHVSSKIQEFSHSIPNTNHSSSIQIYYYRIENPARLPNIFLFIIPYIPFFHKSFFTSVHSHMHVCVENRNEEKYFYLLHSTLYYSNTIHLEKRTSLWRRSVSYTKGLMYPIYFFQLFGMKFFWRTWRENIRRCAWPLPQIFPSILDPPTFPPHLDHFLFQIYKDIFSAFSSWW